MNVCRSMLPILYFLTGMASDRSYTSLTLGIRDDHFTMLLKPFQTVKEFVNLYVDGVLGW